jgi:hypothetical protein
MVQQCSENQYLWEHFTVYMCVERLNSFGAQPIVLCKILLKQSCWTLSNVRCLCVLYRVRVRRVIITYTDIVNILLMTYSNRMHSTTIKIIIL